MLPAEINLSGAPQKASSAEEDPSPEPLKEEGVHFQSSLLREMNDAIAALSKHLKAQALGAPLADTPCHPWDNAEPQTGPEAATAHESTPGVLQETLPGHIHHELLEGDLQEEPASAELRAADVTQAGASAGAGHCTAQEPGAEQGQSPEEAQRMSFLQGKGAGVEEMVLNVAEHLGESMEAGEQVQMEVEGAEWLQETKPQPLGEAEEGEISQRENLEADLGPPEAGQEGVAVGQGLAMDEHQSGRVQGERGTALRERAEPVLGLPGKLETELGEHLEPEPPSWAEAQVGAARGSGGPEVTAAPGPGGLEEERARAEVQPRGETRDSKVLEVLPAQAERAGSSRAGGEEEEVEEAEPREAEQQLQGECARGGAGWRGSEGTLEPLAVAVPPTHGQGGVETDVELMEEHSSTNMELLAEVEADLQVWNEAGSPGTQQGGGVDPGVQLEKDKPEVGLGEEMGAAAGHCEGPSPAEAPVGSLDLCGLFPGKSQALELMEADLQISGGPSPEKPQGGEGEGAVQLQENEEEDGAGQDEHRLPHEPVPHPSAVTLGQGEGAGVGLQLRENAESLDTAEDQSTGAKVQLSAEGDELRLTPGGSTEADLQPLGEAGSSGTEQGGSVDPEVQPLDQEDKEELLERKAEDVQEDRMFTEGPSPGAPWGGEGERAVQLEEEEEEDEAQGQGEHELPHEPVLDLHVSGVRQGEGADEDMQAQEEAERLDTTEDQSTGANVQLIAEGNELRLTPGGSTEADLQPLGEAGTSGTEQRERLDLEVHPLDQGDKAELVEGEAEGAQADLQLSEGLSPGGPWGGEWGTVLHSEEEEEGEAQVQGENGLPQESVLSPEGARGRQGEGAGAGLEPQEAAENLHTLKAQSTDTDVQLFTGQQMPKSGSGGSTEADLTPLGVAGLWKGEQGLTLGLEAVLGPSPTANPWEGAAAADVPPPMEAASVPEPATPAEGPGLEAKLGACIGPEGQILEAQELLQGERAPAEGQPLDGAHGLEAAQGERLEAEVRNGVKTQGLGLNQGHDDAELASLVSEVLSQLSPLKREMMMQEDVLIPDVWRLCAPGLAAQRELQEQVSAQGQEGRLHTVAQQPEGETPSKMEPEHTAAGPAEHPKQEVPPASSLHTAMQPGDAGSDQLGVVLRKNSLGQRQLLGEQSKDLSVGQREKMQEFGQKMSQEGEPSSGEPGAVTACGAGAAPRGCPKAALDPDHLYNVLFIGDSHVGKTSFLYRLHADTFNPHLTATVGLDYQIKTLVVDNERFALRLWDSAGQERYRSVTKQFFRKADGVVLMYDITSELSFSDVRFWLSCIQEGAEDGVAVLLLGNKSDCAAQRQVPTKEGECLAKEHQLMFYECSAASGHNVFESMASFTRLLKVREDELKNKAEEVPKAPQKKKGCCW
uniref:RAB44, member RAS oncogene family n=1 Tax=Taeniopygia guttata TaxID=59729 RepID=A0A674GYN4_TAEGU